MTKLKYWSVGVFAALLPFAASARQLNVEEALSVAQKSTNLPILRASRSGADFKLVHTEKTASLSTVYVLNKANGGFVVLSADDVAAPILGYSETGSVDPSAIPANMQSWLGSYSAEIAAAVAENQPQYQAATYANYQAIAPMLKTTWGQGAPYNAYCPDPANPTLEPGTSTVHSYVGCVATAIAQIMKYHTWPTVGKGNNHYNWFYSGTNYIDLSCDYSQPAFFQWSQMLDSYKKTNATGGTSITGTQDQKDAVALFNYAVAIGCDMNFGINASGSYGWDGARALIENFNYDKALNYIERQYYTHDEWISMIYSELVANSPVYYEGINKANGKDSGHAFVVDGYDKDGYFHINWGWEGMSDGFYLLTALNPTEQGIGGSTSGYNGNQGAIVGIKKPVDGSSLSYVFRANGNFTTEKITYNRPENTGTTTGGTGTGTGTGTGGGTTNSEKINFKFMNGTQNAYLGLMCVPVAENANGIKAMPAIKLVSKDDNSVYYIDTYDGTYRRGNVTNVFTIYASKFTKEGTFEVIPVIKYNGTYYDVEVALGKVNKLKLVVDAKTLTFTSDYEAPNLSVTDIKLDNNATTIALGKACSISAKITNSGSEYYGPVYPALYTKGTDKLAARLSDNYVDITTGSSVNVKWNEAFTGNVISGSYFLSFADADGNRLGDGIEVTVDGTELSELLITSCEFSDANGTYDYSFSSGLNGSAPKLSNSLNVTVTYECTSGSYTDILPFSVVYDFSTGAYGTNHGSIFDSTRYSFSKGEKKALKVNKAFNAFNSPLVNGHLYCLYPFVYYSGNTEYFSPKNEAGNTAIYYFYVSEDGSGLELIKEDNSCKVYPNPAESTVTVSSDDAISQVVVYSMMGGIVLDKSFDGSNTSEQLEVSSLSAGHYVVRIVSGNHSHIARLIKL